jgi:PhnB protein
LNFYGARASRNHRKEKPVEIVPERYRYAVVPHLMVDGADEAIRFYQRAFGATELFRIDDGDGGIIHAELQIGSSTFMIGDRSEGFGEPRAAGGTTVGLHVYVESVDATFRQALEAGATEVQPVQDMFYGDRTAMLADPFGHVWVLLEHVEDLTPDEIVARAHAPAG